MPNVLDYDTIDAVLMTEHVLIDETKNKIYWGWIDLSQMASADTVEIKTMIKVLPTSTIGQYRLRTFKNQQTNPILFLEALPSDVEIKISLRQTEGVAKDYPWKVYAD